MTNCFLREKGSTATTGQTHMSDTGESRALKMNLVEGQEFSDEAIKLDGQSFNNCAFVRCKLVYSGSGPVGLRGCRLTDSAFHFDGAAGNAVAFLNALAADPGMRTALPYIIPNLDRRGPLN
jgi:hypothetical protein